MKRVTSLADMPATQYEPVIVAISTGEIVSDLEASLIEAETKKKVLSDLLEAVTLIVTPEVRARMEQELDGALIVLAQAKEAVEGGEYIQFNVKGMSPHQALVTQTGMLSVPEPKPPVKTRKVPPLDAGGTIRPEAGLQDERYVDMEDPGYRKAREIYEEDQGMLTSRALAYTLICCVEGLDLKDEEIKGALEQEAFPKDPPELFRKRLDQVAQIILSKLDGRHLAAISEKIDELSGVREAAVNFTLRNSSRPNLPSGTLPPTQAYHS